MNKISLMTFPLDLELKKKKMSILNVLSMADRAGLKYIDALRIHPSKIEDYKNAMKKTGVKIYCYISVVSFFENEEKIRQNLEREMQNAVAVGASLFMIVPYYTMIDTRNAKRMGKLETQNKLITGFRLAVTIGEKYDLPVCFETTPQDAICLSGTEDCKYILKQVPGLKFVFDTANMLPHGDDPIEAYENLKPYIVHTHLKDVTLSKPSFSLMEQEITHDGKLMQCTVLGEGVIPIKQIYERMIADGYVGTFALEYARPSHKVCDMEMHIKQVKKMVEYLSL